MHAAIERKRPEIEQLCRELGVRRLDVFGSATGDAFNESAVKNPYFREHVMRTKEQLYAA